MILDWLTCQIDGARPEIEVNVFGETRVRYTTGRYGRTSLIVTHVITDAARSHQNNATHNHSAWCPLYRSSDT